MTQDTITYGGATPSLAASVFTMRSYFCIQVHPRRAETLNSYFCVQAFPSTCLFAQPRASRQPRLPVCAAPCIQAAPLA